MDQPILFLVIALAILICLVILNCLTDNETFMNKIKGNGETLHGGYHIPGEENELKDKQRMDCGGKYKLTHSEKYFVPKDEELQLKDIVERLLGKINKDITMDCPRSWELYDETGKIIKRKKTKRVELEDYLASIRDDLSTEEIHTICTFLKKTWYYNHLKRLTAEELLKDDFLNVD